MFVLQIYMATFSKRPGLKVFCLLVDLYLCVRMCFSMM